MVNKNLSEIIVIADRSGSMASVRDEAISGFNDFLHKQKELKAGDCLLTYCQFNTDYNIVYNGVPIQDIPPLNEDTFVPAGMTALYDAVGKTIDEVGIRLAATPEDKRPGDVTVVILTDGRENSSREYTGLQIQNKISHQTRIYNWSFVFLGQDISAHETARTMGLDTKSNRHYISQVKSGKEGQKAGIQTMGSILVDKRRRVISGQSTSFSSEDKALYDAVLNTPEEKEEK